MIMDFLSRNEFCMHYSHFLQWVGIFIDIKLFLFIETMISIKSLHCITKVGIMIEIKFFYIFLINLSISERFIHLSCHILHEIDKAVDSLKSTRYEQSPITLINHIKFHHFFSRAYLRDKLNR